MNQLIAKPKNKKAVRDLRAEALKITNSIKVEGQSKTESAAIAQGIQRGMEQFLRQQSEKTRDLDKRIKKVKQLTNNTADPTAQPIPAAAPAAPHLPWILLGLSWLLFLAIFTVTILKGE